MANSADKVQVQTFERNVRFLAQQGEERLRNWVQVVYENSASHNFDVVGKVDMVAKTTRATATPVAETPFGRRQSVTTTSHQSDVVENGQDIGKVLVDLNGTIAQALAKAARRSIDARIITAATSASRDGAGQAVNYIAGQIVGDHTAEISFDFVTEVFEKFATNELADEEKCFVIGPKQLRKLQQLVEYSSSDYVHVKALAERGYTPNWMGFTWILHNGLGASGGAGTKDCFAMTRKAIGLHFSQDIWAKCDQDPSISYAWRPYIEFTAGAVRVEDEQLVWAKLKDTVT